MTHSHNHSRPHHHGHHHHDTPAANLSFEQKLVKRIEHWIAHNADHARTYREWAAQTAENGLAEVVPLLEAAARTTLEISSLLEEALGRIPEHRG